MTNLTLSQSAIDTYQRCPRRYYLRYVRGLDWPAPLTSSELDFEQAMRRGEHFHLLIQQQSLGMDVTPMVDASDDEILRNWWHSFLDHARTHMPAVTRAQYTEVELAVTIEGVTVVAKFDNLAIEEDGGILIFDWKTGTPRTVEHLARTWQSVVYQFIATERGGQLRQPATLPKVEARQVHLTYWHARDAQHPVRLPYDDQMHEEGRRRLTSVIAEMKGLIECDQEAVFVHTPNEGECRHCPYRSYCERGREAGGEMDPEMFPDAEEMMKNLDGLDDLDL